jgi:hypothetical protein
LERVRFRTACFRDAGEQHGGMADAIFRDHIRQPGKPGVGAGDYVVPFCEAFNNSHLNNGTQRYRCRSPHH